MQPPSARPWRSPEQIVDRTGQDAPHVGLSAHLMNQGGPPLSRGPASGGRVGRVKSYISTPASVHVSAASSIGRCDAKPVSSAIDRQRLPISRKSPRPILLSIIVVCFPGLAGCRNHTTRTIGDRHPALADQPGYDACLHYPGGATIDRQSPLHHAVDKGLPPSPTRMLCINPWLASTRGVSAGREMSGRCATPTWIAS